MLYNRDMKRYRLDLRRLLILFLLLLILLVVLVVLLLVLRSRPRANAASSETAATQEPIFTPAPTPIDLYAHYEWVETVRVPVYDHRADKLVEMDLEAYIVGVVSAEMPAGYSLEALKAQAVASRTYAVYNILHGGCHTRTDASVCTNSACCQSYLDTERMQERWQNDYVFYYNKIVTAVMETAGEVLCYEGSLIDALYHADSGGFTEDSEHVYPNAIPYLRGVESPFDTPSRSDTVTIPATEAVARILEKYPDAGVTEDTLSADVAIVSVYPSGRVEQLKLGTVTVTGKQARSLFSLDSALFTVTAAPDGLTFSTKGYGHGVGMSQNGANGMANEGYDYRAILSHYYTGVEIVPYAWEES